MKALLRDLQAEGVLERGQRKRLRPPGRLPSVAVLEVVALDEDGELIVRPVAAELAGIGPFRITLLEDRARGRAPGMGDRVLAKLRHVGEGQYEGRVLRLLPHQPERQLGQIERAAGGGLRVRPTDGPGRAGLMVVADGAGAAEPGEMVLVERLPGASLGAGQVRVVERLGRPDDPAAISLLVAHAQGLPLAFPAEAEEQAADARPAPLGKRADLRAVPLVTIDGADARDFDDAVFAVPDEHPGNPGGWRITVAIADVAHYVRPGDPLDQEARRRGNSVYFPDRVLPMLPEALSNGLCSLKPAEERACLAVHIRLDRQGQKLDHRFERALMRSAARLTYEQVQAARDGAPDALTGPLLAPVIQPLYGAYEALLRARQQRGTLDLDLPELQLELAADSRPLAVRRRPRLDAHRLIEEFMIAANVAAAETLEQRATPCMYRIHDRPDAVKLEGLGQLLQQLGLVERPGRLAQPKDLMRLLERLREHPLSHVVSTLLLRAQSQAVYSPANIGHYGLNLGRYAHFTSPIRRYADLLVHRALIRALRLGEGGLPEQQDQAALHDLGGQLSRAERRAMEAERKARARFVALLLADRVGTVMPATVTSVQRFGLFVQLTDSLAEALVPASSLGAGRLELTADGHRLIDRRDGRAWSIGDRVELELTEVDLATGQIAGRLVGHTPGPVALHRPAMRPRASHRPHRRRG